MRNGDGVWRETLLRDAVLAGDENAWRTWYEESYAPLEAYVLWRCGQSRDLADDAIQETWMTAVRTIKRFQPNVGTFLSWLRGISSNVIRNQLRDRRRRAGRQQQFVTEPSCNGKLVEAQERAEQIARTLAALPEKYESVLCAKYLDQQSVAQIAEQWNETPKAIESLLTRARVAFRETFEQQD